MSGRERERERHDGARNYEAERRWREREKEKAIESEGDFATCMYVVCVFANFLTG